MSLRFFADIPLEELCRSGGFCLPNPMPDKLRA
jgi:hypothetical protein